LRCLAPTAERQRASPDAGAKKTGDCGKKSFVLLNSHVDCPLSRSVPGVCHDKIRSQPRRAFARC
jgi:hypothetical protein